MSDNGFPEVPEGHFWRIDECGTKELSLPRISLIHRVDTVIAGDLNYSQALLAAASLQPNTVAWHIEGPVYKTVTVRRPVPPRRNLFGKILEEFPPRVYTEDQLVGYAYYYETVLGGELMRWGFSAEDARESAENVLSKIEEQKQFAERQRIKREENTRLFGDYPPKSLVENHDVS